MSSSEVPPVSVSLDSFSSAEGRPVYAIVWVRGEHDTSTRSHLSVTIGQTARLNDADIVVDLSGVTFMDASTINALLVARDRLRAHSRSLSVRDPSPPAQRVLDLCGLAQLLGGHPPPAQPVLPSALGSWVDVPVSDPETELGQPRFAPRTRSEEDARTLTLRRVKPTEPPTEPEGPQEVVQPRRALS